ncbi:hypothetical protein [Streptomyces sp. NPDC057889]|uniref:hypothetical protein n=1 Tax=unclassified Streptomyces TaxID=2593676 RepID=UPI003689E9B9
MAAVVPPVGSLSELTPEVWKAWAEAPGGFVRAKHVGVLLRQAPGVPQAVVAQMSKRLRLVVARPKKSLSSVEMKRVRSAAAHTVRRAERRISGNLALLERWRAGELDGHPDARWGELLDRLARTGDLPRVPSGFVRNWVQAECRRRLGVWSLQPAVTQLFPSVGEKAAAAVLLICNEGWNLSVLEKLTVPSQWPNADGDDAHPAIHRVDTDKPRRGRRRHEHRLEDHSIPRPPPTATSRVFRRCADMRTVDGGAAAAQHASVQVSHRRPGGEAPGHVHRPGRRPGRRIRLTRP